MRRLAVVLLAATLLAGCATASGSALSRADDTAKEPRRCSAGDPNRSAWYCVVGQILYGAISAFQPPNELATR